MILDRRDIELLRLAGKYRWLPYDKLGSFRFGKSLENEIDILTAAGLIKLSRNKSYLRFTPQGYKALLRHGYKCAPVSDRPYTSISSLRRRLETSEIMLTALRAGIDVTQDNVEALSQQPVFYPAFDLRDGETNLMNAANCAGFGHWGKTGYILEYVSPQSNGMYLNNELRHLHNLSSLFDSRLNAPLAMIFAGPNYKAVHELLGSKVQSKRNGKGGFVDFGEVYRKAYLPIHLLSCDETGAMQLALMRQPDYKARIAKAAYGSHWTPRDDMFPDADGMIDGAIPLVFAADMDIRRVQRVVSDAKRFGNKEVFVAAFMGQMKNLLAEIFSGDKTVRYLSIEQPILDTAFGKDFSLYSMDKTAAASEGGTQNG